MRTSGHPRMIDLAAPELAALLLGPPCRSSLPTRLEHRDPHAALPGTAIVRDLCFEVDLLACPGRFRVLVAEREASGAAGREAA